jgi:DNA-binding NtrC family response regulator
MLILLPQNPSISKLLADLHWAAYNRGGPARQGAYTSLMSVPPTHVLVVEDSEIFRQTIVEILSQEGFTVDEASSGEQALEKLRQTVYDVLVTDLVLPGKTGLEVLRETIDRFPDIVSIVMTGYATVETAVEAMKIGAYDYLVKPFKVVQLSMMIRKRLEEKRLRFENQDLRNQLTEKYAFDNIIGSGPAMKRVFERIDAIAGLPSTILVQGETGTGKELIAKAIHFNSQRKHQKLVSINCGAIPENLLETELFGHVKGAFTGAIQTRIGKFEQADGGTIFLDEIGNMPGSLQVKLLRVIQEREFDRIGSNAPVKVDVRIIAATSANLKVMVQKGTFRQDLYYRLNVIPIHLPPLRERREDIPLLVQHFLQHYCSKHGFELKSVSPEVLRELMHYEWPGNVRQLENFVERMVALTTQRNVIVPDDLPEEIQFKTDTTLGRQIDIPEGGIDFDNVVSDLERDLIMQSLRKTNGNKKLAAQLLNLKRTTLIEKMKRVRLDDSDPVDAAAES